MARYFCLLPWAVEAFKAGTLSIEDLAKSLDSHWVTAYRHLRKAGVTRHHTHRSRHIHLPLADIQRMRAAGMTHQAIAERFGVSRRTIGYRLKEAEGPD